MKRFPIKVDGYMSVEIAEFVNGKRENPPNNYVTYRIFVIIRIFLNEWPFILQFLLLSSLATD